MTKQRRRQIRRKSMGTGSDGEIRGRIGGRGGKESEVEVATSSRRRIKGGRSSSWARGRSSLGGIDRSEAGGGWASSRGTFIFQRLAAIRRIGLGNWIKCLMELAHRRLPQLWNPNPGTVGWVGQGWADRQKCRTTDHPNNEIRAGSIDGLSGLSEKRRPSSTETRFR